MGDLQGSPQPYELLLEERDICIGERAVLRPTQLARHQIRDVAELKPLVERHQVGLDLARRHQVDARQQHPEHIQQRLDPTRRLVQKQPPLSLGEAKVVMRVVARQQLRNERA